MIYLCEAGKQWQNVGMTQATKELSLVNDCLLQKLGISVSHEHPTRTPDRAECRVSGNAEQDTHFAAC